MDLEKQTHDDELANELSEQLIESDAATFPPSGEKAGGAGGE